MKSFYMSKNCLLSTEKMSGSQQNLLKTFLIPRERCSDDINFLLIFLHKYAKVNTNSYIETIWAPVLLPAKLHLKEKHSPSNKTVYYHTRPKRHRNSAKTIFLTFGARKFGRFHHPTSTQWTFMFGLFWRKMPVLLLLLQLWNSSALLKRHEQKYHKKLC